MIQIFFIKCLKTGHKITRLWKTNSTGVSFIFEMTRLLFSILMDPLWKNSDKIYKDNTVCPIRWPSYRINANSSWCLFWFFSQQGSGRVSAEQTKMKITYRQRWKSGPDSLTPCTNTLISIVVINLPDKERSKEVGCITLITVQSPNPRDKSRM